MTESDFSKKYSAFLTLFTNYSESVFAHLSTPNTLAEAMKYSFFAGGKRIRPILMLAFGELLGLDADKILPFAFGLECIHTYSLIHDDLPAMDNDVIRRGKPTCHIRYGEAVALMAGDALLNFAFEHILGVISEKNEIEALRYLAECSGAKGMVSGQVSDKENENAETKDEKLLFETYRLKTGRLLTAPFAVAAILQGDEKFIPTAEKIGNDFGAAFQFADDLKDVLYSSEQTGKTSGKDERDHKFTSVSVYGTDGVKKKIRILLDEVKELLSGFMNTEFLFALIDSVKI